MNRRVCCILFFLHLLPSSHMAGEFRYQLVLQWKTKDPAAMKRIGAIEDSIQRAIGKSGSVDGHDFGAGTLNIFVDTNKPKEVLPKLTKALKAPFLPEKMTAAYRDYDGEKFTVIWPRNFKGEFEY